MGPAAATVALPVHAYHDYPVIVVYGGFDTGGDRSDAGILPLPVAAAPSSAGLVTGGTTLPAPTFGRTSGPCTGRPFASSSVQWTPGPLAEWTFAHSGL